MMIEKPFSPSSERNRGPILQVLKEVITPAHRRLWEIGSGTGQHAVYFAPHFPTLQWVTSDLASQHPGIRAWLEEANLPNIEGPIPFEIGRDPMPNLDFDLVFSANVLHIISWPQGKLLIEMLGKGLGSDSEVLFYGPFNYRGDFTSQSNADFDRWLKSRNPESGIRNFEDICELMKLQGFDLKTDFEMPSNNRILHFQKN